MTTRAAYPAERAVDVVLRDGSTLHVRPIRPDDEAAMLAFLRGLSDESRAFRFFSPAADLVAAAKWAVDVDYERTYGLVATRGGDHAIVGHAVYAAGGDGAAEVAFATADSLQGQGLATTLLAHLAAAAEEHGIATFTASVLPENHRMIEVFRESGFPVATRSEPGELVLELPTSLSRDGQARFEQRERIAATAAVAHFLEPASVALVGASRRAGSIGRALLLNLERDGFTGDLHLVNPAGGEIEGRPLHRSVLDVPGPVELAVIAVPAPRVSQVARECAAKGVRSLVVITAGFAEVGEEGAARQRELVAICRSAGMRLVGPNCFGVLNTAPDVSLNATFASVSPPAGKVGFMSQSGGLGIAVFERAQRLGLGLSSFVSVGNKADVSGNDLLQYWEQDGHTDVVLLYLESFGNPRKFARIARRVGRRKPVLAVKSGRSAAGARAAGSHTGALLAASDVTVDALFRQAGVVRADTLGELFDVAGLMASQPLPAGRRVGILTNAGGAGILCADACVSQGLEVAPLTDATRTALSEFLPPEASLGNPVDMIAAAGAGEYARALQALNADEGVDAIIVIFVPPLVTRAGDVARALAEASARLERPVPILSVFMTEGGGPEELAAGPRRIPAWDFPEDAARALARAADYAAWRAAPRGKTPELPDVRHDEAASIVADALGAGETWLGPECVAQLCGCYGIPLADWRAAATIEEAIAAAEALGGPVAVKAVTPGLLHKTEAGGVRVALHGAESVRAAAEGMRESVLRHGFDDPSFLVQRMVTDGVEMIVGVASDPQFGPVLACGAGGVAVELVHDVAVRLTPVTDRDAHDMVRSLATFPLLDGWRGAPKADVAALEDLLLRVSALVEDHPEVVELDCNPVVVTPEGAAVVDARVRLEAVAPLPPSPSVGR